MNIAYVKAGKLWRLARVLSVRDGVATITFPGTGTDNRHRIPADDVRPLRSKDGAA